MPDSGITKRALAAALKELMKERPFAKISVGDICEKCEMNRKSFYYHFKDKYDLVNWIYYTEFLAVAQGREYRGNWDLLRDLCIYFYENRDFYRKTLQIEGQNSFSEYFTEIVSAIISEELKDIFAQEESIDFFVDFYTDAFVCAIKRWLLGSECIPPDEFLELLRKCLIGISDTVIQRLQDK